ncbi:MAG: DUF2842 domain-containing protein [Paracoccaceae bacterium]|nr:DUF2842 domain-containing protein [Paracoccaceae bacterium]
MALSYKARRRWSLVALLIGMPVYIILAVFVVSLLPRAPIAIEFVLYVFLGVAWVFPLKSVFRGIGQPDPDLQNDEEE